MAQEKLRVENAAKRGKNKSTGAKYKTLHNIVVRLLSGHDTQWKPFGDHTKFIQAMARKKEGDSGQTLLQNRKSLIARHQSLHQGRSPAVLFSQAVAELKASYVRTGHLDPTQM